MRGKTLIGAAVMSMMLALPGVTGAEPFVVSDAFFDAIRRVESTDGRYLGNQDGGKSYGPYQISRTYLSDANAYLGTNYTLYDVIFKDDVARRVMCGYWSRYVPKDRPITYEILARIHNGGPKGYGKEATRAYWKKVKREMEKSTNDN